MSSVARKNTLVVDFSVLPVRPDVGKIHRFLENELVLNLADVNSIQLHNTRNCVFIEMLDNDTAQRYAKAHNIKRVFLCNDRPFKIPVFVDSEAVTVRVHDLPPSVPHKTVGKFMGKFGDVISIQSERWKHYFPGVPNGVRVLQMRLKHPIPSYIMLDNNECLVTHLNQPKSCRWCSKPAHPKQNCAPAAENKPPTVASSSNEQKFTEEDFPPMTSPQTTSPPDAFADILARGKRSLAESQIEADSNNGNDDDKTSVASSATTDSDFIEVTNKRRLSTRKENETKKICSEQCAQTVISDGSGKSDFYK